MSVSLTSVFQGLEPVLEPLRTLDFVGFQEPVLDATLNLKKGLQNLFFGTLNLKEGVQNRFLGTLNFEKGFGTCFFMYLFGIHLSLSFSLSLSLSLSLSCEPFLCLSYIYFLSPTHSLAPSHTYTFGTLSSQHVGKSCKGF
jgi:hypothetical protein